MKRLLSLTLAAALLAEAVGPQLTCVFVDHGLMRQKEADEVERSFAPWDIDFVWVDAEERFLSRLAGVEDPDLPAQIQFLQGKIIERDSVREL